MKYYKGYIFCLGLLVACQQPQAHRVSGFVFGTTYQITYEGPAPEKMGVNPALDTIFEALNRSMSTYIPNSDISRFNQGNDSIQIDQYFQEVFEYSRRVWETTDGAFDPTVGPLVNAYGFGSEQPLRQVNKKTIDSLSSFVGLANVVLRSGWLSKQHPSTALDFNAIAKGYAVDVVAQWFENHKVDNYLIEIGGEIRAKGDSPKSRKPWRVAIDDPKQKKYRAFIQTVEISSGALATSGNYRKFRIDSLTGNYYVHTIDPRTAAPAISNVLSVSVRSPLCSLADAWATALMVLPLNEGQGLVEEDPSLEALWIVAQEDELKQISSSGWSN